MDNITELDAIKQYERYKEVFADIRSVTSDETPEAIRFRYADSTAKAILKIRPDLDVREFWCFTLSKRGKAFSNSVFTLLQEFDIWKESEKKISVLVFPLMEIRHDENAIHLAVAESQKSLCGLPQGSLEPATVENRTSNSCLECCRIFNLSFMSKIQDCPGNETIEYIKRCRFLHSMPYKDYLLTLEWKETRQRKLNAANFRCELCYKPQSLHVHHKTYERRGYEYDADLIVLCSHCHAKFHDKLPTSV